jgi:putative adhesin
VTRHLAFALVLLTASCAGAAEKKLDRIFTVAPNGTLVVEADGPSVKVSGNDGNQVVVHLTARGSEEDLARMTLEASQNGNDVNVVMKKQGKGSWFNWSWNGDGHIEVTVPRQFGINVRTGGGSVELTNTEGAATLHTSGGDVAVKSVTGNLEARTSGGGIKADTIRGDVDASTSGGDVRLLLVDGRIRARTSGGSVECSLVGSNRGISVSTSGGDIELTLPQGTTADVDATTSGGNIKTELPVATTEIREGHLKGSMNGGGQPIEARTSGGSISLHAAH